MNNFTNLKTNIENWQGLTKQPVQTGIIPLLNRSGNNFELTLDENLKAADYLHIYPTLDSNDHIQFYIIRHDLDTKKNKAIYTSGLYPIPLSSENQPLYSNTPSELVTWVDNWCNPELRNNWLYNITYIPQALVIHTRDFIVGDLHKCYFALRPNTNPTIPSKYRMDLVVQNTITGTIINVPVSTEETNTIEPQFRDMARPVPPFGQEGYSSTDESNFGILESI